ncbi:FtsX-like permease family protein [Roseivirga ehrenbergii]|nr:ABC transporter permease [Roseivirga ehrenbergii]TCL13478.1 FtsX-like permease family protein [Roseivirga ehrenbergii]
MMSTHFRFALRSVSRFKIPSLINFLGFAVGLTGAILLSSILLHDVSYDGYHQRGDEIYRLSTGLNMRDGNRHFASTSIMSGDNLSEVIPEITDRVRLRYQTLTLTLGDKIFSNENTAFVDSGYYTSFTTELVAGQYPKEQSDILINESTRERLFGGTDPINKVISSQGNYGTKGLTVVGIFKDYPTNVSFRPNILANFTIIEPFSNRNYGSIVPGLNTFLVTDGSIGTEELNEKLNEFYKENIGDLLDIVVHEAEVYSGMHYHRGLEFDIGEKHDKNTLWIMAILAVFIIISTLINFFNMQTALVIQRSKELSIKQVLGITWASKIKQQAFESMIVLLPAFALSGIMISLALSELEQYTNLTLANGWFSADNLWWLMAGLFSIFWMITVAASLLMSRWNSYSVVSNYKTKGQSNIRTFLIGLQFTLAGFFIFSAIVISNQLTYMETLDLGYEQDDLMTISLNQVSGYDQARTIKTAFEGIAGVKKTSLSTAPVFGWQSKANFSIRKDTAVENHLLNVNLIDADFVETNQILVLVGQNVDEKGRKLLLNEKAVKALGFSSNDEVLGQKMMYSMRDTTMEYTIGGVVADYHFATMHQVIEPMVLLTNELGGYFNLTLRTESNDDRLTNELEAKWDEFFPGYLLTYNLLENSIDNAYRQDYQKGAFYQWATLLLVFVSAMGIFGLTYFYADQKRKEIGIRKAIGAGMKQILAQIGKPIAWVCLASILVSVPLSFYLSDEWLAGYQYRISLGVEHIVITVILMASLAALALIYPGIKASKINPVEALRQE